MHQMVVTELSTIMKIIKKAQFDLDYEYYRTRLTTSPTMKNSQNEKLLFFPKENQGKNQKNRIFHARF